MGTREKTLTVCTCLCTILVAVLSIGCLVIAIQMRLLSSDRDWGCTEDTPGAELANEGVYWCSDGEGGWTIGYPPAAKIFIILFSVCAGVGFLIALSCGYCFARQVKKSKGKELKHADARTVEHNDAPQTDVLQAAGDQIV